MHFYDTQRNADEWLQQYTTLAYKASDSENHAHNETNYTVITNLLNTFYACRIHTNRYSENFFHLPGNGLADNAHTWQFHPLRHIT